MTNPSSPDFNEPLARQVLAQIKAHPETWDQNHWAVRNNCGTTYCFAGWACVIGDRLTEDRINFYSTGTAYAEASSYMSTEDRHGYQRNIQTAAMVLLGVSPYDADDLFASANTIEELEELVNHLSGDDLHAELDALTIVDEAIEPVKDIEIDS